MIHEFDTFEKSQRTVKQLRASLEQHLQKLREQNDKQGMDAIETAGLRGEIKAIKALLKDTEQPGPAPKPVRATYQV